MIDFAKTKLCLILLISSVCGQIKESISVEELSWLTGNWEGPINGNILEETWLEPRAGTIIALVRMTNELGTDFVEIIHIKELNSTLELHLKLFDNALSPTTPKAHKFELTKIDKDYISFKGISPGAHRTLSYSRPQKDVFYIRFQPHIGNAVEIKLTPK